MVFITHVLTTDGIIMNAVDKNVGFGVLNFRKNVYLQSIVELNRPNIIISNKHSRNILYRIVSEFGNAKYFAVTFLINLYMTISKIIQTGSS